MNDKRPMFERKLRQYSQTPVTPRFKVHYAPYGEWGGERVNCSRYYTTDVSHTGNRDNVTCKFCQRLFK